MRRSSLPRSRDARAHATGRRCFATMIVFLGNLLVCLALAHGADDTASPLDPMIASAFRAPDALAKDFGGYRSPLIFDDGHVARTADDWRRRREEILRFWHQALGPWPALIEKPSFETIETVQRDDFVQKKVLVELAPQLRLSAYLLMPQTPGPHPAVLVVYYEPETGVGLNDNKLRDFGYQLTRRGFVTLSIGWPRDFTTAQSQSLQPLSCLAYLAANGYRALATLPEVDRGRVGIVGHSFGGKWAMFASCLYEKFACAAWSDPGIVFDETRPNVNYWEPWYLGWEAGRERKPGVPSEANPRTGPYRRLFESGHDLHELHCLMAPRPFLVSGGSEDPPERWKALNHAVAVNRLLGYEERVAMTNRPEHSPTAESNEQIYRFFEHFLCPKKASDQQKREQAEKGLRQELSEIKELVLGVSARLETLQRRLTRLEQRVEAGKQTSQMWPLGRYLMVDERGIIWSGGRSVGFWGINGGEIDAPVPLRR